jgi:arylsulfatase A-like enzyme
LVGARAGRFFVGELDMKKWIFGGVVVLVLLAAAVIWRVQRTGKEPPQAVFLIVVDTMRADRLSCYGFERHETSNLDALAARGVLFENALANASWTIPSMGTIMTSQYPTQLGLVEVPAEPGKRYRWDERREQIAYTISLSYQTLAEAFHDAGYHTAAFVNQPALNNRDGFVQGFIDWFYPAGGDTIIHRDPSERLLEDELTRPRVTPWRNVDLTDSVLVDAFADWMDSAPEGKIFVWLHLLSPHKPYQPPLRFIPGSRSEKREASALALYNGEVKYCDELIGTVVRAIERNVGVENSLIVFTSDHGEEFGEHNMREHGHSLHREVVHVPLIMTGPDLPVGVRVDPQVRLLDLYPTLVEMCGLQSYAAESTEGVDLSPIIQGKSRELTVYAEGMLYGSTERSMSNSEFKLMWDQQGDKYTLFRPSADPEETLDILPRFKNETGQLRTALIKFHETLHEEFAKRMRGQSLDDSLTTAAERERVLKAMRSLGYVND